MMILESKYCFPVFKPGRYLNQDMMKSEEQLLSTKKYIARNIYFRFQVRSHYSEKNKQTWKSLKIAA